MPADEIAKRHAAVSGCEHGHDAPRDVKGIALGKGHICSKIYLLPAVREAGVQLRVGRTAFTVAQNALENRLHPLYGSVGLSAFGGEFILSFDAFVVRRAHSGVRRAALSGNCVSSVEQNGKTLELGCGMGVALIVCEIG
ncbi:hypothetical protein [Devosia sp.]|uniref:hypothetical protein n=1 Tax=Devosia sp. TaxID=1871048 RepID=UPI001ACB1C94|nr:hypothetical protein [Devosia sp.]MBN9334073.1 hypothetical protein [Devosia sp.]